MRKLLSVNSGWVVMLAVIIAGICSCNPFTYRESHCLYTDFKTDSVDIKFLPYKQLPYVRGSKMKGVRDFYDEDSIPVHDFKGQKNYHPVFLAQYGLHTMDVYKTTQDSQYLNILVKLCAKLESLALRDNEDATMFFPYTFNFPLHSNELDAMKAPWYSGMAQGQILSLYCRMFNVTQDMHYLTIAGEIFNSFTKLKGNLAEPWVSCVTKDGDLWLEEYPADVPNFTLNGHIFGIYGIYDYYLLIQSPEVEQYLKGAIRTVKKNIHLFRNEGDLSSYCLKHKVKSESYHKVHIEQLHQLYLYTGDEYFEKMSLAFAKDSEGEQRE